MSTSPNVYVNGTFFEPMTAQHNFQNKYDLDNPVEAMETYARYVSIYLPVPETTFSCTGCINITCSVMHQHTKTQMDIATRSARRRSPNSAVNAMSSLSTGSSIDNEASA